MKVFAVLMRVLKIQPSELMEMTATDLEFWCEVAREATCRG